MPLPNLVQLDAILGNLATFHVKQQRILPVYVTARIIKDLEVLGVDCVGPMAVFETVRFWATKLSLSWLNKWRRLGSKGEAGLRGCLKVAKLVNIVST